jgi:hypothetical protein
MIFDNQNARRRRSFGTTRPHDLFKVARRISNRHASCKNRAASPVKTWAVDQQFAEPGIGNHHGRWQFRDSRTGHLTAGETGLLRLVKNPCLGRENRPAMAGEMVM